MRLYMQLPLLINVLTILNLFIVAFILLAKTGSSYANRLLALVLLMPALFYMRYTIELMGYKHVAAFILFPTQIAGILHGPIIYAYVKVMLSDKKRKHPVLFPMSAVLFVFTVLTGLCFSIFLNKHEQIRYLSGIYTASYPLMFVISKVCLNVLHCLYLLFAFIWMYPIVKNCKYSTPIERQRIQFVFQLIASNLGLILLVFCTYILLDIRMINLYAIPMMGTFLFLFVFYKMVQFPEIFNPDMVKSGDRVMASVFSNESEVVLSKKTVERSSDVIKNEEIETIYNCLIQYIEQEKPYLNQELSLSVLSDSLHICTHKISLAINQKSGKNFFNFINEYRIREAQQLLNDASNKQTYSIEDIAFMSGFNSRAAFYNAFKKQLNKTPSAYLAESRSSEAE